MQKIHEAIVKEWTWAGIIPKRIIDTNKFGHLIVEHTNGLVWLIRPEELSCEIIAKDVAEFEEIRKTEDFILDWNMESLVELAESKYGTIPKENVFYLVLPTVLGGEYIIENINVLPIEEVVSISGSMAFQIKDLPDGGDVQNYRITKGIATLKFLFNMINGYKLMLIGTALMETGTIFYLPLFHDYHFTSYQEPPPPPPLPPPDEPPPLEPRLLLPELLVDVDVEIEEEKPSRL